ncbi:MAG: 1-deoxy-D-xylulose-5-phosphate reductoisomerase, partial [Caulobacteraceae bacterium]
DLLVQAQAEVEVTALTAGGNVTRLVEQARRWRPRLAVIAADAGYAELKSELAGTGIEVAAGPAAIADAAAADADWVMSAIVGSAGLRPTLAAARTGAIIALANKESLVCAGLALLETSKAAGGMILPVDSEHSAIFQALLPGQAHRVARLILTASGGPFRDWPLEAMARATPEQAVAHPNWSMGAKISIDSATMMNKGLEMIEASYLFATPGDRIEVLMHPQSVVHSLVEYQDGSTLAQLGPPDMRAPIACAFAWPDRLPWPAPRLDLAAIGALTFQAPDPKRFPALELARWALKRGEGAPAALNAANEVAVGAFLDRAIGFLDIATVATQTLEQMDMRGDLNASGEADPVDAALAVDALARLRAREFTASPARIH